MSIFQNLSVLRILVARVDAILRRTNNIDQGEIEQAGGY